MRYQFTFTQWDKIKDITPIADEMRAPRILYITSSGSVKLYNHFGKFFASFI